MFKRALTTLAAFGLCLTFAAAAPAQEPEDLQFNKRTFQDKEVIQAQVVLHLEPAPPELSGAERQAHYRRQAIDKALDWLARRGYLEQGKAFQLPFQVINTHDGLIVVVNGKAVGHLGPGPFFPRPDPELERLDTLFNVVLIREQWVQEPVFNP